MYNSRTTGKIFDIRERSSQFGVEIVRLVARLPRTTAGIAIGNQIIRSGTSIGANIEEAQSSGTRKEFVHGLTISLKEARETEYWLRLIHETRLIDAVDPVLDENREIIRVLITIIKNTKSSGLRKL